VYQLIEDQKAQEVTKGSQALKKLNFKIQSYEEFKFK
jgi:hypothetical protein